MKPWDVVFALEQTASRNDKQEILAALGPDHEFWSMGVYGLSPYITYGVAALPIPNGYGGGVVNGQFKALADKLAKRELTGHAALYAIQTFAEFCTKPQWENWYSRLLSKDLKCGMGVSTFNKVAPLAMVIPVFECQLAAPMHKVKTEKLPTDAIMEAKYDGNRILFFVYKDRTVAYSRNGIENLNFGIVGDQLASLAEFPGFPECGIVVDGEIISSDFQTLQTQARRKTDANFEGLFMAFDTLTVDEFKQQQQTAPLWQRREIVKDLINFLQAKFPICFTELSLGVSGINAQTDQDAIMAFYQQQVEAGFEGIIVKNAQAPYVFKRSNDWLKIKPTDTHDMTINALVEGTGRLVDTLGAFEASMVTEDGKLVSANVGSGLTDDLRAEYWARRANVPGEVIEVEADCISQNRDGTYSLRFPRYKRARPDKNTQ